jgi:hypothetical protein
MYVSGPIGTTAEVDAHPLLKRHVAAKADIISDLVTAGDFFMGCIRCVVKCLEIDRNYGQRMSVTWKNGVILLPVV